MVFGVRGNEGSGEYARSRCWSVYKSNANHNCAEGNQRWIVLTWQSVSRSGGAHSGVWQRHSRASRRHSNAKDDQTKGRDVVKLWPFPQKRR